MQMRPRWAAVMAGIWIFALGISHPVLGQTAEFRGFWADVWGVGFKSTTDIDNMIQRALQGRYNAILPEILAYHDNRSSAHGAYWNSSIVPKAPDIVGGIDPLAYLCQQAHAAGIEVHPWLVPFRACLTWPPTGNTTLQAHPEYIMVPRAYIGGGPVYISDAYYLDPGSPDVQDYLIGIVRELVTNYPIDGIHYDYIRYIQTDGGYPSRTWYTQSGLERFKRITGYSTTPAVDYGPWNDFRRRSITELVRRTRAEVASIANPRQPLRVSTAVITWGDAPSNFQATSSWSLFQNWEEWQRLGYVDSAVSMAYFGQTSYPAYYTNWVNKSIGWRYARQMIIGPATYMNTPANSVIQIQYARTQGADGVCTYCYRETRNDGGDIWAWYPYVGTNCFTQNVLVPTMPWRYPATATEGTLWGRITDAIAGKPLDDATVQVGGLATVQTDGSGYYVATLIPATASGTSYSVVASKTGYPSAAHTGVVVTAGGIKREDFGLGGTGNAPVIIQHPMNQMVAPGATSMFTVSATGDDPLSYQWQKNSSNLSNGGRISGADLPTLQITTTETSDEGSYRCVVSNSIGSATSNTATLTISTAPVEFIVESRPGGQNYTNFVAAGSWSISTGSKSSAAGTTAGIGSLYSSLGYADRTATYSFSPTTTGTYEIYVTWVNSANACSSARHVLTHVGGTATLYRDQLSNGNLWNSLGQYNLNANTTYTVVQYSSGSTGGDIIRADAVKWKLVSSGTGNPPLITQHPADQTVTQGGTASFTVQATGDSPLSYQWQKNGANLANGGNVSGATTTALQITSVASSDQGNYRCVVTNPYGNATSNPASLTISGAGTAPTITQHPGSQSVLLGGTATFTVVASGTTPLTYQWQKDTANLTDDGRISGATTATLQIATVASADQGNYRCVVTNAYGSATSNTATLTVTTGGGTQFIVESRTGGQNYTTNYAEAGTWNDSTAKSTATGVTAGIGSRYAYLGTDGRNAIFSYTPSASGTYEVFVTGPLSTNTPTSAHHVVTHAGGTANLYVDQNNNSNSGYSTRWNSLGQYSLNAGTTYSVTITTTGSSAGSGSTALRADAVKWQCTTCAAAPPTITQQPANQNICAAATATFTIAATGDGTLSYQWQKNGVNLSNGGHYLGATTAALTVSTADSNDVASYRCVVTNGNGSSNSNTASLTLKSNTAITHHPQAQSVTAGTTTTFTVAATGSGTLAYQWQKNSINLSTGGHYSGVATATLTISNTDVNDAGNYCCVVTGDCGNSTSQQATLTVTGSGIQLDRDGDSDVDMDDFGMFQNCLSGPGAAQNDSTCSWAKLDGDVDVDLDDLTIFLDCISGPGIPAVSNCRGG